ncbi:hypothetical protein DFH06DRAFT_1466456 [Mycena polygramma]|nr:hypothetical protein DFH06DRAFT_1466456 [Mycena polygramma]
MRFSTFSVMVAASVALASPTRLKRGIACPPVDDDGAALVSSSADAASEFATCVYKDAGDCTYFFADGSLSSGASTCPSGLPQTAARSDDSASAGTSNAAAAAGAIDPSITCPPVDKDGTALSESTSVKDDEGNEFAQCTYPSAGPCQFFFADGSFSSGSSSCPKGLPQVASTGAAGGGGAAATTSTPAAPPVTSTTPPVVTTSSTSTPIILPPTTSSTPAPPPASSSSAVDTDTSISLSTSFATVFSTSTPALPISSDSALPLSSALPSDSAPVVSVPAVTPVVTAPAAPTSTDDEFTTVTVDASASAVGNSADQAGALGSGNGARGNGVGTVGMAAVVVLMGWVLV